MPLRKFNSGDECEFVPWRRRRGRHPRGRGAGDKGILPDQTFWFARGQQLFSFF